MAAFFTLFLFSNWRIQVFLKPYSWFILLCSLFLSVPAFSQTGLGDGEDFKPYHFIFLGRTLLKPCNMFGVHLNAGQVCQESPSGKQSIFTVDRDGEHADSLVIRFWNYAAGNPKAADFNGRYFLISRADLKNNCIRRYSTRLAFTAGTAIIPVKVRFSPFDFSKDVTLGPTIGFRGRLSHYSSNYFNLLAGFGITSVTLDSETTMKAVTTSTDRPALTPSLGVVFETSLTQFGVFIGQDYVSSKENANWIYQGNVWLSVGLGYTILSRQSKTKPEAQTQ